MEEGYTAARLAGLSVLGSLKRELQDLDRVSAWLMVNGLVNVAPGFTETSAVINGFSDLVLELYGQDVGRHARTAIGAAMLPLNSPVIISAEVEVRQVRQRRRRPGAGQELPDEAVHEAYSQCKG